MKKKCIQINHLATLNICVNLPLMNFFFLLVFLYEAQNFSYYVFSRRLFSFYNLRTIKKINFINTILHPPALPLVATYCQG